MSVKNVNVSCDTPLGNTGYDCFNDFGMPVGFLFVEKGYLLPTTSVAAVKSAIEAKILENNKQKRLYPLNNLFQITNNDEDTVTQTSNTGAVTKIRDGNYTTEAQWIDGGFCLLYAFLKANGKNVPFFVVTDKGYLIGTQAAGDFMAPIRPNMLDPKKFTWSDGTAVAKYAVTINYEPTQINRNIAFVKFGDDDGGVGYFQALQGLQDVTLLQAAARATNVLKVKAMTSCGSIDMYTDYETELAAVGAWVATNRLTGNVITITSVTADANVKGWTITLNASDPDYTATAGDILISLVGPTDLAALDVEGYESNKLAQ